MKIRCSISLKKLGARCGFSIEEMLVSMAVASVSISGIVSGYIFSAKRAEWSAYSLAAQSLALQKAEQVRAAKWDTQAVPAVDEVVSTNFGDVALPLNVPVVGTNAPTATVKTSISTISTDPPLRMVRVDCIWDFSSKRTFTNTIVTFRSPDQ